MMEELLEQLRVRSKDPQLVTEGASIVGSNVYAPAMPEHIEAAERELGFSLPLLLRRIYAEVGNGGFGPGYGLLGVSGREADDYGKTALEIYRIFRGGGPGDPGWDWPERLLPICHLGCGMYACVDCTDAEARIIWWEPNPREPGEPMDVFLIPVHLSLEEWLWAWLRDEDWMTPAFEASPLLRWQEDWYARHADLTAQQPPLFG